MLGGNNTIMPIFYGDALCQAQKTLDYSALVVLPSGGTITYFFPRHLCACPKPFFATLFHSKLICFMENGRVKYNSTSFTVFCTIIIIRALNSKRDF